MSRYVKAAPSEYIKRKFDDAELAALVEDLDLVPSYLITPSLLRVYRSELRERIITKQFNKENVELAIAYIQELLSSEYGKFLIAKWRERFHIGEQFNFQL